MKTIKAATLGLLALAYSSTASATYMPSPFNTLGQVTNNSRVLDVTSPQYKTCMMKILILDSTLTKAEARYFLRSTAFPADDRMILSCEKALYEVKRNRDGW